MKATDAKWIAGLLILLAGAPLLLAEPALKVGSPAPKLATGKWVQGDPVKEFEKGKAYLVEFWATWCPPCRASIPHLNEIYKKYKDKGLVVIGQDCWEEDDSLVQPFVQKMGDKMTYRVALDDKDGSKTGKMAETWMAAAERRGIPSAFLVDGHGVIAWIGHPMELQESVIEEVLAGKYDAQKAAREHADAEGKEALLQAAFSAAGEAIAAKNWDAAAAKSQELAKLLPKEYQFVRDLLEVNIRLGKGEFDSAFKLMASVSEANPTNAALQNQLAWQLATDKSIQHPDLKLAATMADRANQAAEGKDPAILDTVARVQYLLGDTNKAVAFQEKAVALAEGEAKTELEKTLKLYREGKSIEAAEDRAAQAPQAKGTGN